MRCQEIQNNLNLFIKNDPSISAEEAILIQEHLKICSRCLHEFEATKRVLELLKKVDVYYPRDEVWKQLLSRISQPTLVPLKSFVSQSRRRIIAWSAAVAALLLVGLVIYTGIRLSHPSKESEKLTAPIGQVFLIQQGELRANNKLLKVNETIRLNQPIVSDESATAILGFEDKTVGVIGKIGLVGKSHLVYTSPNQLKLYEGNILMEVWLVKGGNFVVETPTAYVEVQGTTFSLVVTAESTFLEVIEGKVKFANSYGSVLVKQRESYLAPKNAPPSPSMTTPNRTNVLSTILEDWGLPSWQDPLLEIESLKQEYQQNEPIRLKLRITNRTENLWFLPFSSSDRVYLLVNVTTPQGQVFYTRFKPLKGLEKRPENYQDLGGQITFPAGSTYELEGTVNEVFNQKGLYRLRVVYGASPLEKTLLWRGLIESNPISIEIK